MSQRGNEERRIQGGGDGTDALAAWLYRYYWNARCQDPPHSWKDVEEPARGAFVEDAEEVLGLMGPHVEELELTAHYVADRLKRTPSVRGSALVEMGDLLWLARKLDGAVLNPAPAPPESAVANESPTPEEPA